MKAILGSAVFGWSFALARSLTMCVRARSCVYMQSVLRGDTVKIDIHYMLHYY